MSAIKWLRARVPTGLSRSWIAPASAIALCSVIGAAGVAVAQNLVRPGAKVESLLKARLPKTELTKVDCEKLTGLCEVTAGANLFYVDQGARYLVIGRVYDMETRQDLTAARLLEINPDMLVGGAATANAAGSPSGREEEELASLGRGAAATKVALPARPSILPRLEQCPALDERACRRAAHIRARQPGSGGPGLLRKEPRGSSSCGLFGRTAERQFCKMRHFRARCQ